MIPEHRTSPEHRMVWWKERRQEERKKGRKEGRRQGRTAVGDREPNNLLFWSASNLILFWAQRTSLKLRRKVKVWVKFL